MRIGPAECDGCGAQDDRRRRGKPDGPLGKTNDRRDEHANDECEDSAVESIPGEPGDDADGEERAEKELTQETNRGPPACQQHRPNVTPVAPPRATADTALTADQRRQNMAAVHRPWKLHNGDVRHSLVNGFYQRWDLHPAQLPTHYAALYAIFLAARPAATLAYATSSRTQRRRRSWATCSTMRQLVRDC